MKLYYAKGACSLAPHIALREVGLEFTLEPVSMETKRYRGGDFREINPKGYVPTLQLDDGTVLTEVQVILQWIADRKPEAGLLPLPGGIDRYRALEWLNYVATEVHKGFGPLWKPDTPDAYKEITRAALGQRFQFLSERLRGKNYLMGERYSVADCYLFTVLGWSRFLKLDMTPWPELLAYLERIGQRPAVRGALEAEGLLK